MTKCDKCGAENARKLLDEFEDEEGNEAYRYIYRCDVCIEKEAEDACKNI